MQQSAPGLLPLFRSETQLKILGALFVGPPRSWQLGELARHLGLNTSTATREVAHLEQAGVVQTVKVGRTKLVSPNWALPWAEPLAQLLDRTIGAAGLISEALADLDGVSGAWIFGSWAERYAGKMGPAPRDVDVLVVGDDATLDQLELQVRLDKVARQVGVEVNPTVVSLAAWAAPEGFLAEVLKSPMVTVRQQEIDEMAADRV